MSRLFVPIDNLPFFSLLFQELPAPSAPSNTQRLQALLDSGHPVLQDLGGLASAPWTTDATHTHAVAELTGLNERPHGLVFYGLAAPTDRGTAHAVLYRAPDRWRLEVVSDGAEPGPQKSALEALDEGFFPSPNQVLGPCPSCGHRRPAFQRLGTAEHSSVVACGNCDFSLESKEEAEQNGVQWNRLARLAFLPPSVLQSTAPAVSAVCGAHCQAWAQDAGRSNAATLS